jgi:uncharacterized membrane protein
MDNLFGLPAHPVVIHAAVVLLPVAAIGTILVAISISLRRRFAIAIALCAVAAAVTVWMAQESGQDLEDRVKETDLVEQHTEEGETVLPWAIGVAGVAVIVAGYDRYRPRHTDDGRRNNAVAIGLTALAVVAGAGATYSVARVGHSGAKAVWHDTPTRRVR